MTGKKRELGVGCVDLALSERPGRKGWMEAANKRSVRSVTCLRGPAHSHQLGMAAGPLEHKVIDFEAGPLVSSAQ